MSSAPPEAPPRRVLRIITRLNVGGPALQAILLTERLDPSRFRTRLVTGEPTSVEGDMLRLRGATVRPDVVGTLGRDISPLADARSLASLVRIVREYRPHIVHTHMAKAGLLGRIAARLGGAPVIVHTFHGNVLRGYFDPVRSRIFLALERALARLTTRVVAISPRQRQEIRALGIATAPKLVELPLGVELSPFLDPPRGSLRAELGIGQRPLVGIVGRLVPIKAVDVFIDAMADLGRSVPAARSVVVGDGEMRRPLEEAARARGLDGRLTFLGWRADLRAVYGDLDVVVLTSDNEGTPVSILEALAAARPVVATAVGGVPDVIDDTRGVLVPPRDPRAVAAAVVELIGDPTRAARLGAAGRAHVYPAYDIATLVSRIERLYTDLADTGPTRLAP
ncbi:MAG: glycosyltransferase [Elusimicrobia bacterium]|nr:glycosyltransferase [Elusimicrobiota bacterium]